MSTSQVTRRDSCEGVSSLLVFTPLLCVDCPNLISNDKKNKPLCKQEVFRDGDANANPNDVIQNGKYPQADSLRSDSEVNNISDVIALDHRSVDLNYGIHWQSPTTMVGTFLCGVCLAVALHCYYSSLSGEIVGNIQEQQNALRSACLLATSALFKAQYILIVMDTAPLWHFLRKCVWHCLLGLHIHNVCGGLSDEKIGPLPISMPRPP